jgi:hypothetical protein
MSSPEPTAEPTAEEIVQGVYADAAQQMHRGVPYPQIEANLVAQGLPAESAAIVVQNLREARLKAVHAAGGKNMLYGALWCAGGTVLTVATLAAAVAKEGGGTYVVAWGAIIFGAIQFFRGLFQSMEK